MPWAGARCVQAVVSVLEIQSEVGHTPGLLVNKI